MDYEPLFNIPLTLSSSQTISCINISILSDLSIEDEETFLVGVTTDGDVVNFTTISAIVFITDQTTGIDIRS